LGEDEPLWLAETGYSSVGERGRISEVYWPRFRGEHTAAFQAGALARTVTLGLASGRLSLLAWYRINDLPAGENVIGDDNNRHLGLRDVQGRPKPALAAFAFFARQFDQAYRLLPLSLAPGLDPDTQVHAFELRDGRRVIVAWLGTAEAPPEPHPAVDT